MYTMKEVCRETGMTYEALKFYCNEGLVPNVKRDANNHRVFDDRDVAWIKSLTCLKNCGMSIQEMKVYIGLCLQGEPSIPERKVILARKREDLLKKWQNYRTALTISTGNRDSMIMCCLEKSSITVI